MMPMAIETKVTVFASRRRQLALGLMGLTLLLSANAGDSFAQGREDKWPDRPVHFIVPFPAGSATDIVARIVAQKLNVEFGQPFLIDNRPGASGELGTTLVAQAKPDGYTIGLATSSTHTVSASLNPKLAYSPVTDFAHVSMIGASPYVLAVYIGLPANNIAELIALAKAKPRALNFASAGPESLAHIAGALFSTLAGVELTEVPYRSSNQAILDLTEGRIEIQFGTLAPTLGQIRSNKVRPLAVTGAHRIESLPDVPTLQEAGLKDYDVELWMAVVMPAATPPAIVTRLNRAMRDALAMKEVVEALKVQGMEANSTTPEALRERIRTEIEKWTAFARAGGLKVER
jgi:tripartite-type tricarboxylate transporter receptor subunit TctC